MQKQAKISSKGQITIPRDIRRAMGVQPGDQVLFESDEEGIRLWPVRTVSPFAKYQGIGNPGIASGRKAINRWVRKLRGQ
jgi:antitoxin PrlF